LVINKWVIAVKIWNFSGHYLRNRSTLDIGVLSYIGIVWPKEHSPEVWHIPLGTPCIYIYIERERESLLSSWETYTNLNFVSEVVSVDPLNIALLGLPWPHARMRTRMPYVHHMLSTAGTGRELHFSWNEHYLATSNFAFWSVVFSFSSHFFVNVGDLAPIKQCFVNSEEWYYLSN